MGENEKSEKGSNSKESREKASTYHVNNGTGHHDVCCSGWIVKVMGVVLVSETAGVARSKSAAELSETTLVLARHGR